MNPIWTCKNGKVIPVSELEEEHLVNIIKMWRRNVDYYRRRIESFIDSRFDEFTISTKVEDDVHSWWGVEGMLLELEDDDFLRATFPIFNDLLWECISRGLMDGDTGEWLRQPELRCGKVDVLSQLEIAGRIIECGVLA